MKNLVIVFMTLISLMSYGQQNRSEKDEHRKNLHSKMSNLSPVQRAELATKKMTLRLDLNEAQQQEINKIELERAKTRQERHENTENRKNLTDTDRFDRKSEMLDAQIAHKKKMKSILNEEQYNKWQSERHSKKDGRHKRQKHSARQ